MPTRPRAIFGLAMAGCSAGGTLTGCTLGRAVDLPIIAGTRSPTVEATPNGQKVALLIDTGAALSTLSRGAAGRFDLRPDPDARDMSLVGIGGVSAAPIVTVRKLSLGHGSISDIEPPVDAAMAGSVHGLPLLGMLGTDFLSNDDVDIDMPAHHSALYRTHGCGPDPASFDPPCFQVSFHADRQRPESQAIAAELKLDGAH